MNVYCVFCCESHVGEFLVKLFSSKEKAQAYIDEVSKFDKRDFEIELWEIE